MNSTSLSVPPACYDSDTELWRQVLRILLSVVFPPVGVFLKLRFHLHFWISVLLTLFGYIPGLVHAIWVLARDQRHFESC